MSKQILSKLCVKWGKIFILDIAYLYSPNVKNKDFTPSRSK